MNWENFRKGKKLKTDEIRRIYDMMSVGKEVARGHKQCPKMLEDERYSIAECCANYGLKTTDIWHRALSRISEEDREYYMSLLRNEGESLKEPRIQLSTIHQAKDLEADNVLLLLDMSSKTAKAMEVSPDAEHRVWYVGVSRAKEKLCIMEPMTANSYPIR